MKTSFLLVVLFVCFELSARSQVLGVFEQGAEELREYGQQIAALGLLLDRQEKGYQVIESGLSSIGSITGGEFGLHQEYYAGLGAVKPVIGQSPDVTAFLSMESQMLHGLTAALSRWRQSQYLTATDLAFVTRMSSVITNAATLQLSIFKGLTSNGNLVMSDDQRVEMMGRVYAYNRRLCVCSQAFIDGVEFLILNRKN
jgi:hypothetical protein